jgi:dTDP-4-dehydrorhamnose reductase
MVFDGTKGEAYGEGDRVRPVNIYGMTKASAEREVLRLHRRALVIRTSAFFGPWDDYNFVTVTLRRLANGEEVAAASDLVVSPTYLPDLVNNSLDLLLDGESGIWHMSNCGSLSWADLALSCARMAGLDPSAIIPRPSTTFSFRAKRPPFSALFTTRGARLPDLDDALQRYFYDAPSVR